jgi:hypothetical protein
MVHRLTAYRASIARAFLIAALCVAVAIFLQCDLLDDGEGEDCSLGENNMIVERGDADPGACADLIKTLKINEILAKSDLTYFEITGEILIDFGNDYYLRGDGINDKRCMSPLFGQSLFTLRAKFSDCSEVVSVDIIDNPQPDSAPLCAFKVEIRDNCEHLQLE